jgi:hypothetical protein
MARPRSKLGDAIRLSAAGRAAANLPRERKRRELIGNKNVDMQNERRRKIIAKGGVNAKGLAKDAVTRVGEYRRLAKKLDR